jgi:hypothetical protein
VTLWSELHWTHCPRILPVCMSGNGLGGRLSIYSNVTKWRREFFD